MNKLVNSERVSVMLNDLSALSVSDSPTLSVYSAPLEWRLSLQRMLALKIEQRIID